MFHGWLGWTRLSFELRLISGMIVQAIVIWQAAVKDGEVMYRELVYNENGSCICGVVAG